MQTICLLHHDNQGLRELHIYIIPSLKRAPPHSITHANKQWTWNVFHTNKNMWRRNTWTNQNQHDKVFTFHPKVKDTAVYEGIKCVIEFIGLIFRFLNQVKGWQLSHRRNIDRTNMQGVRVFVQHNRGACIINACRMFSTTHHRAADQRSYKLVVVGGGTGGCSTAARFCHQLGKGKVAVIEPSEVTYTPSPQVENQFESESRSELFIQRTMIQCNAQSSLGWVVFFT